MRHRGIARLDRKTKNLVKRLGPADVAIVDHADMDRVSAESLVATGVEVVVNASPSITGAYPNLGPLILLRGGVHVLDSVGPGIFEAVREGEEIEIDGADLMVRGQIVASGTRLTLAKVDQAMEDAKVGMGEQLDQFARNTLEFLEKERAILSDGTDVPRVGVDMRGRHVLVVVRGYDYREDLGTLRPYISEVRPVLLAVDGGADALLEVGLKPSVIVGDMDSVSDDALLCGAELVLHAYPDGRCPAADRLAALGLSAHIWPISATSEDLALLLAYESGADLIVGVGMHGNLVEYLDKGRKGMASSFLVRLKVGPKLVDAKGVNKLYRRAPGPTHLLLLVGAALTVMLVTVLISSNARTMLELVLLRIRAWIGL